MLNIGKVLAQLGKKAKTQDLATNLIYWNSYSFNSPVPDAEGIYDKYKYALDDYFMYFFLLQSRFDKPLNLFLHGFQRNMF